MNKNPGLQSQISLTCYFTNYVTTILYILKANHLECSCALRIYMKPTQKHPESEQQFVVRTLFI